MSKLRHSLGMVLVLGFGTVVSAQQSPRSLRSDSLPGIVVPERQVTLSAAVDGVLMKLAVEEGDRVVAGQEVARLDDRLALAAVKAAQSIVERQAAAAHARAELAMSEQRLERVRKAVLAGGMTPLDLEEALAKMLQAEASVESAREVQIQAENNLAVEVERQRRMSIRAPFAGRIIRVHSDIGATLSPVDELVHLVSMSRLKAELHVPVSRFGSIRVGDVFQLAASAPVTKSVQGQIKMVDPLIDPATQTFRCVVMIDNSDESLPAGFTVEQRDTIEASPPPK